METSKAPCFTFEMACVGPDGQTRWKSVFSNTVTTAGKNNLVDQYFKGSSYTAAFYLGLKGTGTTSTSDTLASHAGWAELTPYSGNRPAITWGTTAAGSNTASAVSYAVTESATVAGAFIATAASGTSGTLYSVGNSVEGNKSVSNGDTLNVTPSVIMA